MKQNDLTKGSPFKSLILFAIPMILSVTLQQIYNIADSSIAGQMIDSNALASVSASYPITMIYLSIATGLGIGSGVVVSRYYGAKEYKETKTCIYTALLFTFVLSIIVALIGALITNLTLKWIDTPENIFEDSAVYLRFYCFGLVFTFLYNVITCIFQSLGDSKTPLYFLLFSTILNVGLDILFVGPCNMRVLGLALGTFIAQGIAMIASLLFLIKSIRELLKTEEKAKVFEFSMLSKIQVIAIPSIFQGATISFGNFFIQRNINSYGADLIAGYGAAYKLCYVIVNIFTAYSNAISNFTSQNLGAGKPYRIVRGLKVSLIVCVVFALICTLLLTVLPGVLLKIFMDSSNTDAITYAKTFMYMVSPFFIILGIKMPFDGVLKGSKDMIGFMLGTFSDLILRIVLSYALSVPFGYQGIFASWPIGWFVGCVVVVSCYFAGRWKKINHLTKDKFIEQEEI